MTVYFISHPEVDVDPARDVRRWSLSMRGAARMQAFAATGAASRVTQIWSSRETKALEAAAILAGFRSLPVQVHDGLGENDRSATGFLPPDIFEATADAFFAHPDVSIRGWETAQAAQARIHAAISEILEPRRDADIAVVSHGAVGTLLYCALAGVPIDRAHDQPGQGHFWAFDPQTRKPLHGWRSIDPPQA